MGGRARGLTTPVLRVPQVCALRVSSRARSRILKAGGKILTFDQLALDSPKGCGTVLLSGEWGLVAPVATSGHRVPA